MNLTLTKSYAFSQGADIKADIKRGWCAGLTALVSKAVGDYTPEYGMKEERWVREIAYNSAMQLLQSINSKEAAAKIFQQILARVEDQSDVSSSIHSEKFNGRSCKVLISTCEWIPLIGYMSYIWNRKWTINHVGLIVRGGNALLIFEPNYGVGLFSINDDSPLTLDNLTKAIGDLAWAQSGGHYYLTNYKAMAVVDEGPFRLRTSRNMEAQLNRLMEMNQEFYV